MKTLDLGCGPNDKLPGSVGVDLQPGPVVDVVHDLDVFPYPFADDEFDFVEFSHVIEHVKDPKRVMEEIHRISRNGARVHIITPHYTSQAAYGDITHLHHFGRVTFTHLCERPQYDLESSRLVFTDLYRLTGIAFLANRFQRKWEKYWAFQFPALYVDVTLQVRK